MATTVQNTNTASQALLDSVNGKKSKTDSTQEAQDRFMTLLVTQMKNQDPLNPMDNAQVTSQMAQLSTVSGINKLNSTVESLMSSLQMGQSYQAANMIGHGVLVEGKTLTTNGEGGYFGVELPVGADKLSIDIKDTSGNTIRTLDFG
ncbi:MAG TPA: flagellar hook capping FlgD N-terminal domain-containing protein, partial [Methylophilaceae bacterium]|nr:flagellar hook capping FlgD N-terminal domain-containing protein [Methylophilaceae bacterium]